MKYGVNRGGTNERFKKRRSMRDDRDGAVFFVVRENSRWIECGQKVGSGEMLCSKNAIHGIERKLAAAVEEIGKMRLAEPGLTRQ
jgi:hypothetical protein